MKAQLQFLSVSAEAVCPDYTSTAWGFQTDIWSEPAYVAQSKKRQSDAFPTNGQLTGFWGITD